MFGGLEKDGYVLINSTRGLDELGLDELRSRHRYEIDLDFCKGCGICVSECPSGAIQMVPEEI